MKLIRNIAAFQAGRSLHAAILMSLSLSAAHPVLAVEEVDGVPVPVERPDAGNGAVKPGEAEADPGDIEPSDAVAPEPRPADAPAPEGEDVVAPEPRPDPAGRNAPPENGRRAGTADGKEQDDGEPAERRAKDKPAEDKPAEEKSAMPPPRPATMPAAEAACRSELGKLGVEFSERPQLADPAGCSVPWPIEVRSLSATVQLTPPVQINCATALATARFAAGTIAPKAKEVLGAELAGIRQDSGYVCRPRNGTSKLSEHAYGNALDIGAFMLSDERQVAVGGAKGPEEAAFMLAVRLAACGPFKTVLGPGSDADHASHFHFDLQPRRSGSLFCQ